jgi:hypothetical protein
VCGARPRCLDMVLHSFFSKGPRIMVGGAAGVEHKLQINDTPGDRDL